MLAASAAARPAAAAAPAPAPQLRCAGLCGIAAGKAVGEQQQAEQAELQLLLLPLERSSRHCQAVGREIAPCMLIDELLMKASRMRCCRNQAIEQYCYSSRLFQCGC